MGNAITNFNTPALIRTPSGLSIQKATVVTGSIGSGIHGVTRSLPTLPEGLQVHRESNIPAHLHQQLPNKNNQPMQQMVQTSANTIRPPRTEVVSAIPHERLTR